MNHLVAVVVRTDMVDVFTMSSVVDDAVQCMVCGWLLAMCYMVHWIELSLILLLF